MFTKIVQISGIIHTLRMAYNLLSNVAEAKDEYISQTYELICVDIMNQLKPESFIIDVKSVLYAISIVENYTMQYMALRGIVTNNVSFTDYKLN